MNQHKVQTMRLLMITCLLVWSHTLVDAAEFKKTSALFIERKSNMTENTLDPKQKRRNEIIQLFKDYPDKISPEIQEKILAEQIILGMTPYDAYLAAGAFAFKVIADPSKWEKNTDPYKVMWAQSTIPDDSKIWMTFQNDTQYPKEGKQSFRVFFKHGKAVEIEKQGRSK